MKTKLLISKIAFAMLFNFNVAAQCELYQLDFQSGQLVTSQYSVTCGTVSGSQWSVSNAKCQFTTSSILVPGSSGNMITLPVGIEILNSASTNQCNDYALIQYNVDNTSWVQHDSINVCDMAPFVETYAFDLPCTDTSSVLLRVVLNVQFDKGSIASEKLRIRDGGICVSYPSALPIVLAYFNLKNQNQSVKIDWATESEINNEYFSVERSKNGKDFETIIRISGAGNSSTLKKYSLVDYYPLSGISYYRLKQTDYNGAFSYSDVKAVSVEGIETLRGYPNPVQNNFKVDFYAKSKGLFSIRLYDAQGRIVESSEQIFEEGENNIMRDFSGYARGLYNLQIQSEKENYTLSLVRD